MKKKFVIIISIMGIIALIGVGYFFRDDLLKFKRNIYPVQSVMKSEESHNEEIAEDITSKEEQNEEEIAAEEQVETNSNKKEPTKNDSTKLSESSKSTTKNNTPPKTNNNSGGNNSNVIVKQEEKPVVVQKQPWEELGLTEDQYKNQPMYSWEEVDFKTKDECMNYGNEHAEYGFECSEVTSWTRSLGWDYKTF